MRLTASFEFDGIVRDTNGQQAFPIGTVDQLMDRGFLVHNDRGWFGLWLQSICGGRFFCRWRAWLLDCLRLVEKLTGSQSGSNEGQHNHGDLQLGNYHGFQHFFCQGDNLCRDQACRYCLGCRQQIGCGFDGGMDQGNRHTSRRYTLCQSACQHSGGEQDAVAGKPLCQQSSGSCESA
ncbi:MAG TPA: hypothetical protein VKU02_02235 [Gemmataceae bacterium]|nr:hypothetical protein [Gemmataceae bacterium]